jgi:hypothetical protein
MRKISNDDNFENYLNKYISMEINGVVKKFYVSEIDSNSFVTNAGILRNYNVLGESESQQCDVCESTCFNNIPIIELNFIGKGRYGNDYLSYLIDNKVKETHDVFLNNNKICRINTESLSANINRLWLIPFYSSNVQIPNYFDDEYGTMIYTSAASCVFFDPSYYKRKDWNYITINPVSANNPNTLGQPSQTFFTNFYGNDLSYVFHRYSFNILNNKILVNNSNVSSVSCDAWLQYRFDSSNYSFECCYPTNCYYLSTSLIPKSYCQQVSTFFIDLDPCQNPTEYNLGFTYDGTRYYADDSSFKYAYLNEQPPDPYFGAPSLRKHIFYSDCSKTNTVELYNGKSNTGIYGSPIWYSDLGLTPYNGFFYVVDDTGDVSEVEVVNGEVISSNFCP